MELVFGMVGTVFDFFVDLGNRVDFLGLNLWQISFFVFMICCLFRWLFPVIFAGAGATGGSGGGVPAFLSHGEADSVGDGDFYVHSGLPELGTISSYKEGSNSIE